tara:strand:+ start:2256 stop:3299 length:1044 start_codon:yes stop_codon:yes gene_type:complete
MSKNKRNGFLAIHHREGSFSNRWIDYCKKNNIDYKLVDCFDHDILKNLKGAYGLMWHWTHWDFSAQIFARQLIKVIEDSGTKVFPSFNTCWHFDDKISQKYLLESIDARTVDTYIFFKKQKAIDWAKKTTYPKVFKLSAGAGSSNVFLVKNFNEAKDKINKIFNTGFSQIQRSYFLKERVWHFKRDKSITSFLKILIGLGMQFFPTNLEKNSKKERNYAYFQDFIPNNNCDIRIIVIGTRAFAIKRLIRDGDFRASGSGKISYNPTEIPKDCIRQSFQYSSKIKSQCMAYDYVKSINKWVLIEVSYAFNQKVYEDCQGYWDIDLNWNEGKINPQNFMIIDFLESLKE